MGLGRRRARGDDRGATAAEYALLVGLISVVSITGVQAVGAESEQAFVQTAENLDGPSTSPAPPRVAPPAVLLPPIPSSTTSTTTTTTTTIAPTTTTTTAPSGPSRAPTPTTTTTTTTTTPSRRPPVTTTIPPVPSSFTNATASRQGDWWTATATLVVRDRTGEPLPNGTLVQIQVTRVTEDDDGRQRTRVWNSLALMRGGSATVQNGRLSLDEDNAVVSMTYAVVRVRQATPADSSGLWDGTQPTTTIDGPSYRADD